VSLPIPSSLWFRMFALCLAVGLGAGYIGKRQKAIEAAEAEALRNPERRSILPGSKSPWGLMDWKAEREEAEAAPANAPSPSR
jgi:hypothetical protein